MNKLRTAWYGGKDIRFFANGMEVNEQTYTKAKKQNAKIQVQRYRIQYKDNSVVKLWKS